MTERERGIGGRKANPVHYIDVIYKECEYTVGIITKLDDSTAAFVFDTEDKDQVLERHWHCATGGAYVSSTFRTDDGRKELYLHNLVMDRPEFSGKGTTVSVDHINGIGTDNRKSNLRVTSQSQQNRNRSRRPRTTEHLPADIDPDELPQNVWYIPTDGHHGDRFAVEIKGIPGMTDILWRTTSSKTITAREKLGMAIAKRNELYETHEALRDYERESERSQTLLKEYEDIIAIATS